MAKISFTIEDREDRSVFIDMREVLAEKPELDNTDIAPSVMIALAFQELTSGGYDQLIHSLIDARLDRMNMRRDDDGKVWDKDDIPQEASSEKTGE